MRRPFEKPMPASEGLRVQSTGLGWKVQTGHSRKGHVQKQWGVGETYPSLRFRGSMLKPTANGPAGGKMVEKEALYFCCCAHFYHTACRIVHTSGVAVRTAPPVNSIGAFCYVTIGGVALVGEVFLPGEIIQLRNAPISLETRFFYSILFVSYLDHGIIRWIALSFFS